MLLAAGATGAATPGAQAQQAFSPAWFASKGAMQNSAAATGYLPNGTRAALLTNPAQQQQQANAQLQRSINNLSTLARGIAAQQAAQEAARQAALANGSSVPDGLAEGGLKVDTNSLTRGWINANAPAQSAANGRTTVTVQQIADKAILNWETFNVGKNTILNFAQDANWAVLNRINDPLMRPSQIQGQINAPGTVMIANRNGIVFAGSSQIDVRNLVAAAARITDDQFRNRGLYVDTSGTAPSFTDANGKLIVEAGARITTAQSTSVTQGGGYVLLLGSETSNAGRIATPGGQTVLAAGDSFTIRKGIGSDGNQGSSTAGNEVSTSRSNASGVVNNSGLIVANTGDITLTGHQVIQAGAVVSTSSTAKRGTIHLSTRASDVEGSVTLAPDSVTGIVPDSSEVTALDSQREALVRNGAGLYNQSSGVYDNLSTLADRKDLSRIEIVSGKTVQFQGGSTTLATGGEIVVTATRRTLVDAGATVDVSGAVGVKLAMNSNTVAVNVQGNEQRDAPVNRDSTTLNNLNVWVDRRDLVLVPAGTNGYAADRWYTAGGLLEVSGYLGTSARGGAEWMAQGGTVTVSGGDLVTRAGSSINLSGGTLDVASGMLRQSWIKGSDGRLYNVNTAPGDLLYAGVYRGFEVMHARWGDKTTEYYYNPLIAPQQRYEDGYTVGRDAGRLVVSTHNAALEGTLVSETYQGPRQTKAAQAGLEGYQQLQYAAARRAQLIVGQYLPVYDSKAGGLRYTFNPLFDSVTVGAGASVAGGIGLDEAVAGDRAGQLLLDGGLLNAAQLGAVRLAGKKSVTVSSSLRLADGGEAVLFAPLVDVAADIVAHGGTIRGGNVLRQIRDNGVTLDQGLDPAGGNGAGVILHAGARLDATGRMVDLRGEGDPGLQAYIDGGTVSLRSTDSVTLAAGSVIDVSSGATLQGDGTVRGGKGGSVQLGTGLAGTVVTANPAGTLTLDGTIRGYGVKGGGKLDIESASAVVIGGKAVPVEGVLEAGKSALVGLVLKEDYQVRAGDILPVDYKYLSDIAPPGYTLVGAEVATGRDSPWYDLPDDWVLPVPTEWGRNSVQSSTGQVWDADIGTRPGSVVIPKNTRIQLISIYGAYFAGFTIPARLFPNGMKLKEPRTFTTPAGQPATVDFTIAAGTALAAGAQLTRTVAVAKTTNLDVDLFASGFSSYSVRGYQGLMVAPGVALDVRMPVLQADAQAPAGTDGNALSVWLPELYQPQMLNRSIKQRQGASLTLAAGIADIGGSGDLTIGRDAALRVDPGQSITLAARGGLSVDGVLQAKSGSISVQGSQTTGDKPIEDGGNVGDSRPSSRAIELSAHAVLDASAASYVATDARGRPFGIVADGGSVAIGGILVESKARALAADSFVVVREGALVDVSGTAARFDIDGTGVRTIASNGGSIQLLSARGIYLDGSLRAGAGAAGSGAAGGTLTVALDAPNYLKNPAPNGTVMAPRELTLVQQKSAGASDAGGLQYGHGLLGVNQVRDGGFSSLVLHSNGLLSFNDNLNLSLDRELRVYAGALTLASGVNRRIDVALNAPYVLLSGSNDQGAASDNYLRPSYQGGLTSLDSQAVLNVSGMLIDIKDKVVLGTNTTMSGNTVERPGFGQLNLVSQGDIRFTYGTTTSQINPVSTLTSRGDILLRAAQVYPATGTFAEVSAGVIDRYNYRPDSKLVLERYDPGAPDPAMPYAMFGSLKLGATSIDQGGVLRAPLGTLNIGTNSQTSGGTGGSTTSITFKPGSLTSVSAAGLTLPYGGTSDGVNYLYRGNNVEFKGVGGLGVMYLDSRVVTVAAGARLDLSGGGEVRGAGFVSGRGGSTDARLAPLMQVTDKGFSLPGLATNPVYAIVPGYASAYAPADAASAIDPRIGQQVTIGSNQIPGLAAGTYTLLPSNYALLPGAFRVEFNGALTGPAGGQALAMRNGSWTVAGALSTANTALAENMTRALIVTPGDVLRRYAQYNETGYSEFALRQAALAGTVRPMLPADARNLFIALESSPDSSLSLQGNVDFTPAPGGQGGMASIKMRGYNAGKIEILADGAARTPAFDGLSLYARDLNALNAGRLVVGGSLGSTYGRRGGVDASNYIDITGSMDSIVLRQGALLRVPDVFLITDNPAGSITIEAGAGINTIGLGRGPYDSLDGYVYRPGTVSVLALSNGVINTLAPQPDSSGRGSGAILLGVCGVTCNGTTQLYSEGSLLLATRRDFQLTDAVRYGTRNLMLAAGSLNAGSAADLAAAAARGALTPGLTIDQQVLSRLLRGDTAYGAPALERLILTAADSVNLFGNVSLSTIDPATGRSSLANLVLTTPAIYGVGAPGELAEIRTGKLTWAGQGTVAPAPITGGRGSGTGRLVLSADVIELGYDTSALPTGLDNFGRTILGFADVALNANERITASFKGSLSVYQSQTAGANGPQYQGGNLSLQAPLITGAGGSVNAITAGGALQLSAPASGRADPAAVRVDTGAELKLSGNTVSIDTTVVLPSGKLTVSADGDIRLGDNAWLDLGGREIRLFDVSRYSWGGELSLQSSAGGIHQAGAAVIDLSARNNNAGQLNLIAMGGTVDMQGTLRGDASGRYDAGGTLVPYRAGSIDVRALALGGASLSEGFSGLNDRLNAGGVSGERSFQFKQGDLVIGNELKANRIKVSLDGGQLVVNGVVDASGEKVGSIRLAAANGLTLAAGAVLDAHGSMLRVDSYGKIIDSPNRATVQLDAGNGTLTLQGGSRIDLRHGTALNGGDGNNRGTLDLFAARVGNTGSVTDANAATFGDIAIDARGAIDIQGARSIAVYGRQRYSDAADGTDPAASGRPYQVIDQAYLDARHAQATAFIDNALANGNLLNNKLAGLNNAAYRQALHLRPAIEIVSATPQGDLVVQGDLDLSGLRYNSLNPGTPKTGVYGSGEVGMLTLRAGGDLSIYGSINDGFAPPPDTPDDGGWALTPGVQKFGGDVVVPIAGITLVDGTVYPTGKTLNYAITVRNVTLPVGTVLPSAITLDRDLALPAGSVLAADVRAANGSVLLAAGSVVGAAGLTVPAGAQLLAGVRLPVPLTSATLTWPKGAPLPVDMTQSGSLTLPVGALIAAGTNVKLNAGVDSINLRPADANGRQARNWAVAQMLPEGSQSWSLAVVAGADTGAADTRARNTIRRGDLVLADTHYGIKTIPGGTLSVLNADGVALLTGTHGLPMGVSRPSDLIGKTMAQIIALYGVTDWSDFIFGPITADFWDPAQGNIQLGLTLRGAGEILSAAGSLPNGMTDVSQLVGKTESELVELYTPLGASSWADFGLADFWKLASGNGSQIIRVPSVAPKTVAYSVLRTGTGDLSLAAGGNFSMLSPYGVYTAGTQRSLGNAALDASFDQARGRIDGSKVLGGAGGDSAADYEALVSGGARQYRAWYPDGGGNLNLDVGGNLTGDSWAASKEVFWASSSVGNWLWRQGTGGTPGVAEVPTAWWINFGTYMYNQAAVGMPQYWPTVVGFTGLGTLGGGNASIRVGGDASTVSLRSTTDIGDPTTARSQGVVLAVGSSGRVLADGSLALTGGGDLDVRLGGGWNSHIEARVPRTGLAQAQSHELYGALVGLRGALSLSAGQIGTIERIYGPGQDARDLRTSNPYIPSLTRSTGGVLVMAGDSGMDVASRGDLVLGGTGNAGLVNTPNTVAFSATNGNGERGMSWFSLWSDHTALRAFSAGGDMAFDTRPSETNAKIGTYNWDYTSNGGWFMLPGEVSAVAGVGSIYYGQSLAYRHAGNATQWETGGLLLAPQGKRNVELLAGNALYGGGYPIAVSGADGAVMATIWHPGFFGTDNTSLPLASNVSADAPYADVGVYPLLAFGVGSIGATAGIAGRAVAPSRFYAGRGDIVGLQSGATMRYFGSRGGQTDYIGAGPVAIRAGRDIVYTGTRMDEELTRFGWVSGDASDNAMAAGNLLLNSHANDVSVLQAGRDILYANVTVAGPGTLEVSAGRNIVQYDRSSITSIGPVVRGDSRPGASIAVLAGLGDAGISSSYSGLLARYLNPANLAQGGTPLADQPGKVAKTYGAELSAWLGERFGFSGTAEQALAYFNALAPEQQRIFARQIYFAELRAGGREYNDASSPRYGSYLRGRNAIAAMFPATEYQGDLLMYGASGIHTDVGGDIQILTPGGAQTFGVEGIAPPSTAGLITRGRGDISLYSQGSILLGQSRIMTTFGGGIMAWSAQGDINAGRGAKTTVVYTPPRRVYDNVGDVTMSPQVPSAGAGIATLAPIAEVPPGDVDLIAPLGTIDAGEAGIRVSGNINVAALQIVNAANIQVQGKSTGLPVIAAVNIGALTNASAAASSAAMAAQDAVSRERAAARQNLPSVFTVRVLGFGADGAAAPESRPATSGAGHDSGSAIQVLGQGNLNAVQRNRLTDTERRNLDR
ncbi:filamentous haemagglutinin family protein [Herbaspirillum robiniae]|uniref:filamentous haemagglutinin family protein n=1 Tax=Herbaspirillum robiniae TaxID=2014887 RepID=UPI003D7819F5